MMTSGRRSPSWRQSRSITCSKSRGAPDTTSPAGATPPSPPYTLEDLLAGLPYALPPGFGDHDRLVAAARVDVPAMYGAPGI